MPIVLLRLGPWENSIAVPHLTRQRRTDGEFRILRSILNRVNNRGSRSSSMIEESSRIRCSRGMDQSSRRWVSMKSEARTTVGHHRHSLFEKDDASSHDTGSCLSQGRMTSTRRNQLDNRSKSRRYTANASPDTHVHLQGWGISVRPMIRRALEANGVGISDCRLFK